MKLDHPLPADTRVRHYGQQWRAARHGTATIRETKGPWPDGTYEYRVTATVDFSRRSGPDNPETREAWWSSQATVPASDPKPVPPTPEGPSCASSTA